MEEDGSGVTLAILVQPRAAREKWGPVRGDRLKIAVTAAPVAGAANRAVIDLASRTLGCRRNDIEVIGGERSRRKTLRIRGLRRADLEPFLA